MIVFLSTVFEREQQRVGCGAAFTFSLEDSTNIYICKYTFQDIYNYSYIYTGE
jgi:hypothetical protein